MIWLSYAGLSGALIFSVVLVALVVGLSVDTILAVVADMAVALLAFGMFVHLCAVVLRKSMSR